MTRRDPAAQTTGRLSAPEGGDGPDDRKAWNAAYNLELAEEATKYRGVAVVKFIWFRLPVIGNTASGM